MTGRPMDNDLEPVTITVPNPPVEGEDKPEAVVKAAEPAPKAAAKSEPDPAVIADLKRQIAERDAGLAAERTARQSAEHIAQQQHGEAVKFRTESQQRAHESVVNGLDAAKASIESAEQRVIAAREMGDHKAELSALKDFNNWTARERQLEDARVVLEEAAKAPAPQAPQPRVDPVEGYASQVDRLSPDAGRWIRQHPEFATDQRHNTRLQAAHYDAEIAGHKIGTEGYIPFIEQRLGMKQADPVEPQKPAERERMVAAPVARSAAATPNHTSGGIQMTLSPDERAMARSLEMTDEEYALGKLARMRAEGRA